MLDTQNIVISTNKDYEGWSELAHNTSIPVNKNYIPQYEFERLR